MKTSTIVLMGAGAAATIVGALYWMGRRTSAPDSYTQELPSPDTGQSPTDQGGGLPSGSHSAWTPQDDTGTYGQVHGAGIASGAPGTVPGWSGPVGHAPPTSTEILSANQLQQDIRKHNLNILAFGDATQGG